MDRAEHLQPLEANPEVTDPLSLKDRLYFHNQQQSKYTRRKKIGAPTLGRSTEYVSDVGLGNLEVTTAYDNPNVQPKSGST